MDQNPNLQPFQAGETLSAKKLNTLVEAGKHVYRVLGDTRTAGHITPKETLLSPRGPASVTAAVVKFAKITAVERSTPPFLYSGVQVTPASGGVFTEITGGDLLDSNMYNIGEVAYPGAGKVPVDRYVMYWAGATGEFLFDVLHYRGTFG